MHVTIFTKYSRTEVLRIHTTYAFTKQCLFQDFFFKGGQIEVVGILASTSLLAAINNSFLFHHGCHF